ncbi:MAG: catalase [Gammaproteobacteria bacterium]|nr:catalase [Gammaproteobacteria bacterium]
MPSIRKLTTSGVLLLSIILTGCDNYDVAPLGQEIIPEGEDQIVQDISKLLTDNLRKQYAGQKFLRDTHPKANACLHGTFSIDSGIDAAFQQGVFQPGASYPVWMRFSNAVEELTSDYEKDFRGLGVKLSAVEGERQPLPGDEQNTQDFLFLGHDAFFAANPQEFFDFFFAAFNDQSTRFLLTHLKGAFNILRGQARFINPLNISWNSVTAYALGPAEADGSYENVVRYALETCVANSGAEPDENKPDYLAENIANQLQGDGRGCLDFFIQKQVDAKAMPVENALVAWDQKKSPFIKIGRIEIPAQVFTSEAQKDFCENMSFNPWHSLVAHKPLGGINRARKTVMKDISDERLRQNNVERTEPTGYERFE